MLLGSFCSKKDKKFVTLQPKSLRITGIQKGFIQCLEICQSITSEVDLEQVNYVFPTDNNLCIYSMKFQIDDEMILAQLRPKKAAQNTFKEAKKIGRAAAIAKKESLGVTSINIGNISRGKVVAIIFQCAFTSTLQNPTTILAKIPLQASETYGAITDLYNIPSLEINVDLTISQLQPISNVHTNCESKYEKFDDCNGKLTIKSSIITDENILIITEFSKPVQSQIIQTRNSSLITVIPDFKYIKNDIKEYVFLIDCSASMLGESIRKAKESLHLFLSKLPDGSYFNIICFGTTYNKLFPQSSQKVESTIYEAKKFVDDIRANLGGTEMLSMLCDLFKDPVKVGGQRQIFIITDGEAYNRQKVIQKVSMNSGFNRIFAIGLGKGADAGFLDEVAETTHGLSSFVFNSDELPAKVAELLDAALGESATCVQVHIEGNDCFETEPSPLPPLLPGAATHLFVATDRPVTGALVSARLRDGEEIESVISLISEFTPILNDDEDESEVKSPIYALFAFRQLKKILGDTERCVSLSLSSGVLCSRTSYVAVSMSTYFATPEQDQDQDQDNEKEQEQEHEQEQENEQEQESDSESRALIASGVSISSSFDEEEEEALNEDDEGPFFQLTPSNDDYDESGANDILLGFYAKGEAEPIRVRNSSSAANGADELANVNLATLVGSSEDDMLDEDASDSKAWRVDAEAGDIIRLQSRDGFFDLHSTFYGEKSSGFLPDGCGVELPESPIVRKRVASTLFTLAYLARFLVDCSDTWKFAREKGIRWLNRINSDVDWEKVIEKVVPHLKK